MMIETPMYDLDGGYFMELPPLDLAERLAQEDEYEAYLRWQMTATIEKEMAE